MGILTLCKDPSQTACSVPGTAWHGLGAIVKTDGHAAARTRKPFQPNRRARPFKEDTFYEIDFEPVRSSSSVTPTQSI